MKELLICAAVVFTLLGALLCHASGKEKWEHAIDEISDTGAFSEAKFYCIISSHGFEQLSILDEPSTLDFIMAGLKDTNCHCSCIQK